MNPFFEFCVGLAGSALARLLLLRMPPLASAIMSSASAVLIPNPVPASSTRFADGSPLCSASTIRPYEQPPPPIRSASIPESRNLSPEKTKIHSRRAVAERLSCCCSSM